MLTSPACRTFGNREFDVAGHLSGRNSMRFTRSALLAIGLTVLAVAPAWAAGGMYISPMVGYTTPGSLELGETDLTDVSVTGGLTWGGQLGFAPKPGFAFEASWMQQESHLSIRDVDVLGLKVGQLHGVFLFEKIAYGKKARPYFLLGAGATFFNPDHGFDTKSKFSWSIGAGVKADMSDKVGLKVQGKYNPSYLSDDWGGTWCDPFYGCYAVADPDYLDQGEFSAGLMYKFGQ
jgi:opacity protein-like surface antigen